MTSMAISLPASVAHPSNARWRHLMLGVVCMIMIANLQYGWSVFVLPLQKAHSWAVSDIQLAFTLFVALETWATPMNAGCSDSHQCHRGFSRPCCPAPGGEPASR
jgi:OFA family oxalate/formate antiporter-like MFS transporter